jgi:hypothetical protein
VPGRARRDDQQAEAHPQEHQHVGVDRLKVAHVLVRPTVDVQEQDSLANPVSVLEMLRERTGELSRLVSMLRSARWKLHLRSNERPELHPSPLADVHVTDVIQQAATRHRRGHVRDGGVRG